jgi:hypothetical protein
MANERPSTRSGSDGWSIVAGLLALTSWLGSEKSGNSENLTHPDVTFEPSDINATGVVITGACVLAFAMLVIVFLYPVFEHFLHVHAKRAAPEQSEFAHAIAVPPEPRVQNNPRRDLAEYINQQQFELHRYGVNQQTGAATIPIERAMDLLVQRGIPPQNPPPANMFYEPRAGTRLTGLEGKVEPEPR